MSDIPTLIAAIERDRTLAVEVLSKLPLLLNTTGLVQFDLDTPVQIPSVQMLQQELTAGNIGTRVGNLEALSRGMVQEIDRVVTSLDLDRSNPYWSPLDLKEGEDSDLTDALYRAQVEDGLRLPFDGFSVNQIDRKFDSGAARIGDWMLPNHSETVDNRTNNTTPSYNLRVNVAQYPAIAGLGYRWNPYAYYRYYYGYYYAWWRYRFYGRYYYLNSYYAAGGSENGSMTAQTFQVDAQKVLTGFNVMLTGDSAANRTAANARVILTEASYGRPDMEKVIARGTFRDNAAYQHTGTTTVNTVNVDLDRPVLLKPGKSYAFIVVADATFWVNYTANTDDTGGLFYTQDGAAWEQDIAKDIAYELRFADFGVSSVTIELEAAELSGGIASMKQDLLAEMPEGGGVQTEMEVNGQWLAIEGMDTITSLPPYTPMRIVLTGTSDAMPLIDTTKSTITAFRPATALRFYSKTRGPAQELRVTYELVGFNETWHTFDPGLDVDGTRHTPSLIEHQDSADGNVRSISAVYELPASSEYRHDIIASTQTAAKVFDIASIIEINA